MGNEDEVAYNETTCTLRHETDSLPAIVFMWSGTYIDIEGRDAVILCRAAGNPTPQISWYTGDDRLITSGHHYQVNNYSQFLNFQFHIFLQTNFFFLNFNQILPSGDLKIHHLRWNEHMGLYKCRVENEFGLDESVTFVYPVVVI